MTILGSLIPVVPLAIAGMLNGPAQTDIRKPCDFDYRHSGSRRFPVALHPAQGRNVEIVEESDEPILSPPAQVDLNFDMG